jgi:hypothetical protein
METLHFLKGKIMLRVMSQKKHGIHISYACNAYATDKHTCASTVKSMMNYLQTTENTWDK